jgi:selenide,water dikinase
MYLPSTGKRHPIGTGSGVAFAGRWVWRLKDWIDRRFMAQFSAVSLTAQKSTHGGQ